MTASTARPGRIRAGRVPDHITPTLELTVTSNPTPDRPFRDEPSEVLQAALGLAAAHAEQAARFRATQPGDELPAVVGLFQSELQHRGEL